MDLLPATVYDAPPRQARGRQLKTIMEEGEDHGLHVKSDSEGEVSDSTIIGKPAGWDPKLFIAAPRNPSRLATNMYASSPVSSAGESPCSSAGAGYLSNSGRNSFQGSDNGTVFSDDNCPSLASDPTTFATDSSRNSIASSRSGRNRYPALLIPRNSWGSIDSPIKDLALAMSPASKIRLSPSILSRLTSTLPADNAPPSLGGSSSSVASQSPCISGASCPATPDLNQLDVNNDPNWNVPQSAHVDQPLEIAIDEDHSILLSPAEAHEPHSAVFSSLLSPREREWGDIVVRFPVVPGALNQLGPFDNINPGSSPPSETGVHLSSDALKTLQRLTRERSPDNDSESSRPREEMRERSEAYSNSRPRSLEGITPISDQSFSKLSDYSFTQLSIPSPGGFFSSLQAGTRHTWCINGSQTKSVPTSATAERFYNCVWNSSSSEIKQTVVSVGDTELTDGPPTARQAVFDKTVSAFPIEIHPISDEMPEDPDLYGAEDVVLGPKPSTLHEYEEAYDEVLKHAAEVNMDRTGSWLAAQTTYLSALRETNPANDPVDFLPSPHPFLSDESSSRNDSIDSSNRKTVHFLHEVKVCVNAAGDSNQTSPCSENDVKDPIFHVAFKHLLSNRRRRDAFFHAAPRLEAVRATRIAVSRKHINSLLGQHLIVDPKRPKYSGPFNQNPRSTGIFDRTAEQLAFEAVQREQRALRSIQPSNWRIEALRALFNGRLLASPAACERLTNKAATPLEDPGCVGRKRHRILDFGGEATGSWAWHAAHQWPNVKVYTVLSKEQAQAQRPKGEAKPEGPPNHRTVSVPHLWQLPFPANHFDVISARGLHVLLRNNPVPGVPEIDEWQLTLRECMRVLKRGGYLDYMIMDSTIARAGDRGEAMSVEFGFELHRRGYEREAARSWLRRLKNEGFVGVKRAWMFLPMGRKHDDPNEGRRSGDFHPFRDASNDFLPAPRPVSEVSTISKIVKQYMDVEAVQGPVGSTQDVADITGLLGAGMWEEWLVKVRAEAGWEEARLLDGIDEVIEEGQKHGSGWKVLVGWAKKPSTTTEKPILKRADIQMALLDDDNITPITTPCDTNAEMGLIPMIIQN